VAVAALVLASATACGGDSATGGPSGGVALRLGYFPNLTHATALVGVERGTFAAVLRPDRLRLSTFNAGPAAVEALFSGALDAAYLGPNPAINAFVRSKGEAIRIVSGATSGGASLVVRPTIADARDLRGTKLATPQLGGTQDVALRHWLRSQGLETDIQGGGDVSVTPQDNAQTLETFRRGLIDGAWVPEPWVSRMVQEAGAKVLLDEASLWPGGRFVTTQLAVRTEFLRKHPETVRRLLRAQVETDRFVNATPAEAQQLANRGIERVTGKKLAEPVVAAAWRNLTFTNDPVASSLPVSAAHATAVGLLDRADLRGIHDLRLLNEVLAEGGARAVAA
jgi:NitT/TauT family transport system substrate-binding protein